MEAKPRKSVVPKGGALKGGEVWSEGPPKGGVPKGRALSLGLGSGLNVGLWIFRVWAFCSEKFFGQNTKTLKLTRVGLAKVGQRAGQSWFGQSRP